jgi:hypothetical protein
VSTIATISPVISTRAKTTPDTYGHLWPENDESTTAVIDAVVDSKFRDLAD